MVRRRCTDQLGSFVVLCALACSVHALYEDQAGSFDWHQEHVGSIRSAGLHATKPRAFIGSAQNVVSSLNLRDGSISWRKLLDDPLDSVVLLEKPSVLLSVSSGGSRVRAWDQNDGGLRWEAHLGSPAALHSVSVGSHEGECQLAVTTPAWLKVIDCKSGLTAASRKLPSLQGVDALHTFHASAEIVVYGYTTGSSELKLASLSSQESSHVEEKALSSPQPLSAVSAAGPAGFAALSADLSSLCTLGAGAEEVLCVPVADVAPELSAGSGGLQLTATASGFLLHAASGGAALISTLTTPSSLLKFVPSVSAVSSPVPSSHGQVVALTQAGAQGALTVLVLSTSNGAELSSDSVASPRGPGAQPQGVGEAGLRLAALYLGTYRKKENGDGFRSLVVWEDEQVALLQQGKCVWSRAEALAAVTSSLFVDLPVAAALSASHAHECDAAADGTCAAAGSARAFDWEHFVKTQVLNIKVQFKINSPEEADELVRLREEVSDRTRPEQDANGFRKLIVSLTSSGTLAAQHNGDGHVVWSRHYPQSEGVPSYLLPWRLFHDLKHAPQLLLLSSGGAGPAFASVVDAHTGAELQRMVLPAGGIDKVLSVHKHITEGHLEQSVYLLVEAAGEGEEGQGEPKVHLLPDTPRSRSWFASNYQSLYFWQQDATSNTLTGYGFSAAAAVAVSAGGSAQAVQVWQLAPAEPILGVTSRDLRQAVQSSVKILGDRSIKYKYLNPNTLLVALGATPGNALRRADDDDDDRGAAQSSVTLALLDSATGRVLHSQVQAGAVGPVRLLLTENLAVAEMWDTSTSRMSIVSMELFDATPRVFNVLDYLFNPNSTKPISSFDQAPLEVITQMYWTRAPSKFLAVTTTQQGITSKQLIVGMVHDQVYTMDIRFVDPRRPRRAKLTTQEQEERLMPYQEYLPLQPNMMATYDKKVLGLNHVTVEPSRLESTCLVFVSGVDLFYTRLAPARKYDSLEDDFAYGLLVVALGALLVGAIAMQRITKKSMLAQKWT